MDNKEKVSLLEGFTAFLEKHFDGTTQEVEPAQEVVKSVDLEQRKALFVALAPEVEDLHGDIYSAEEIEKACHNYNTHCSKANLFHEFEINEAYPVESYINPCEFTLDDDRVITKGSWLQLWTFDNSEVGENLWKSVKSGDINGISIGCRATVEDLDE